MPFKIVEEPASSAKEIEEWCDLLLLEFKEWVEASYDRPELMYGLAQMLGRQLLKLRPHNVENFALSLRPLVLEAATTAPDIFYSIRHTASQLHRAHTQHEKLNTWGPPLIYPPPEATPSLSSSSTPYLSPARRSPDLARFDINRRADNNISGAMPSPSSFSTPHLAPVRRSPELESFNIKKPADNNNVGSTPSSPSFSAPHLASARHSPELESFDIMRPADNNNIGNIRKQSLRLTTRVSSSQHLYAQRSVQRAPKPSFRNTIRSIPSTEKHHTTATRVNKKRRKSQRKPRARKCTV